MDWYIYPIIVGIGFFAGFINTLAGGGSALSLPMLIFTGMSPQVANGTNRIAILLQNAVGTYGFARQDVLKFRETVFLLIFSVIGGIPGAFLAVNLNEFILRRVIGGILLFMLFLVIFKPDIWIKAQAGKIKDNPKWLTAIIFFMIGAYGGFIQVGTGFFMLAGLALYEGMGLVKANAIKVFLILAYTPLALVVFILNDQVNFKLGLVLAVGNMLGAWVGAKAAVKRGQKFVRYVLIIALAGSSLKLFGVF